jgi:uncharacterized protein YfiM (DUF2279 family)
MNTLLLVLAMNLQPVSGSAANTLRTSIVQNRPADAWFGQDKLKHAFMSTAVVGFASAGARTVGLNTSESFVIGVSAGALAGLWKEWHDRRIGRPFSYRDLVWDAIGITAGAIIVDNVRE